mmetsp:Transcript_29723/g.80368  ORF Transcript_29723/g.80368 Transcript_29723/m.80368 type:complete len:201 (+) Transcript_29723:802-1404(+)
MAWMSTPAQFPGRSSPSISRTPAAPMPPRQAAPTGRRSTWLPLAPPQRRDIRSAVSATAAPSSLNSLVVFFTTPSSLNSLVLSLTKPRLFCTCSDAATSLVLAFTSFTPWWPCSLITLEASFTKPTPAWTCWEPMTPFAVTEALVFTLPRNPPLPLRLHGSPGSLLAAAPALPPSNQSATGSAVPAGPAAPPPASPPDAA